MKCSERPQGVFYPEHSLMMDTDSDKDTHYALKQTLQNTRSYLRIIQWFGN